MFVVCHASLFPFMHVSHSYVSSLFDTYCDYVNTLGFSGQVSVFTLIMMMIMTK